MIGRILQYTMRFPRSTVRRIRRDGAARFLVEDRFALLGLVVAALFALLGIAYATTPRDADPLGHADPTVARVESSVRVCPPPVDEDRTTEITAFSAAAEDGSSAGRITVAENAEEEPGDTGGPDTIDLAGEPWVEDIGEEERHTVLRATGALAGGLEAVHTTLGESDEPAAAMLSCPEPGLSSWFPVPAGGGMAELDLYLANVDDSASTVNIDIYTPEGPVMDPEETRGISVDAHGERVISLSELTTETSAVAVHVRTNRGRVAASLHAARSDSGADWVPPVAEPARRLAVPGVPPGGGSRELIVATPSDEPVRASVRVFTAEGEVQHEALEELDVPPAASANRSIEGPLDEQGGTVLIEADGPVVAGVATSRHDGDDATYAAAAPPLQEPLDELGIAAVVPDTGTGLLLSALEEDAEVLLTPVSPEGEAAEPREVAVAAGHTEVPELDDLDEAAVILVELASGSGAVHAGQTAVWDDGDDSVTASRPLWPVPSFVALPQANDSLSSALP